MEILRPAWATELEPSSNTDKQGLALLPSKLKWMFTEQR